MFGEFLGNGHRVARFNSEGSPENLSVSRGQDTDDQGERGETVLLKPSHDWNSIRPSPKFNNDLKMLASHVGQDCTPLAGADASPRSRPSRVSA